MKISSLATAFLTWTTFHSAHGSSTCSAPDPLDYHHPSIGMKVEYVGSSVPTNTTGAWTYKNMTVEDNFDDSLFFLDQLMGKTITIMAILYLTFLILQELVLSQTERITLDYYM